ncbi:dockerin type I domain-containing protein [uncultured Ruminococcus sp.]|uniref:dockerin type I domain-containing protein n=1 Tax=uncultured Ruminococcus sp. TaxID=165186 RepID=UPI0026155A88|nr:dockerin type I domain-containing protein [uncultured Ruminococcus sp.]
MNKKNKCISVLTAAVLLCTGIGTAGIVSPLSAQATESIEASMDWDAVRIGGGGFVSGIVAGQKEMYARTDVGGAYRYNYETEEWEQLFAFLNEADRGLLSVDSMAIDPTDDNTVYFLCGCAYFSDARTVIFKTTDGGKTFTQVDVTDMIQVHGNGYGRQCGESIAVDPDNPDVIYCGGDVASGSSALIMSKDGGKTWSPVKGYDDLGYYQYTVKWPFWTNHTVRAATTSDDNAYNMQNGVSTIFIQDGKVYVGTSVNNADYNMVVADVGSDEFTQLSADLPANAYPSRITTDNNGNLFITYVGGLTFDRTGGGAYKYNIATGSVTNISPSGTDSMGEIYADPADPNKLVATTCGVWSSQLWYEGAWEDDKVCWGDQFYRSEDGGATWESITPGNAKGWGQPLQADYLQDGGFDWIQNKAIHWVGSMVLDPRDSNKIVITSGNGIFNCDNVWDELPVYYFHPNGVEEVVALDMISIPGGNPYSAIGDYDGFEHADVTLPGKQHQPNMGSTSAIAYCPQNPDVMVRIAENQNDYSPGYYTTDGGTTWNKMANSVGGKAAITQLNDSTYRIFKSGKDDGNVSYSDDWGQTWNSCSGITSAYGSKTTYMLVEPDQPNVVYAYATYYNSSWFYSKTEPDFSDAHYTFYVSTDYGKTFTGTDIAMYDQCDSAGRIAYLGEDNIILGAGWYGMYHVTNGGKTVEQLDVFYCKTVGYGAPEKEGGLNTLYMYGKPQESDPEGIYRSVDGGSSWVLINQNKLYGGTGNGNFLVGDMNTFGTVYMSTVGCGIICGKLTDSKPPVVVTSTTTTETTTTETTTTTSKTTASQTETTAKTSSSTVSTENTTAASSSTTTIASESTTTSSIIAPSISESSVSAEESVLYGDVNLDGRVDITDAVLLNKATAGAVSLGDQAARNADCDANKELGSNDAMVLLKFLVHLVMSLPDAS